MFSALLNTTTAASYTTTTTISFTTTIITTTNTTSTSSLLTPSTWRTSTTYMTKCVFTLIFLAGEMIWDLIIIFYVTTCVCLGLGGAIFALSCSPCHAELWVQITYYRGTECFLERIRTGGGSYLLCRVSSVAVMWTSSADHSRETVALVFVNWSSSCRFFESLV